jgi:hypothetical protein
MTQQQQVGDEVKGWPYLGVVDDVSKSSCVSFVKKAIFVRFVSNYEDVKINVSINQAPKLVTQT